MIDKMPCTYETLRTTAMGIQRQVSHRAVQRSQLLSMSPTDLHGMSMLHQNLTIVQVKSRSILNTPPYLQMLSGALESALAQSESCFISSSGAWKHLEELGSTGEVDWSVWEICMGLLDWFTLCWCCVWPYIIGQEILDSDSFSLAMNTQAMSQHPTLPDEILRLAWTLMICLEIIWLGMHTW